MQARTFALLAGASCLFTACATGQVAQTGDAMVPSASHVAVATSVKRAGGICYGTFGVEATPCPVKLTKKDGGSVVVTIGGPGVVIAVPIASDCVGSASVCNLTRDGSALTQFVISSTKGSNLCGKAYVVFEGLTASEAAIGTATVQVINKYC